MIILVVPNVTEEDIAEANWEMVPILSLLFFMLIFLFLVIYIFTRRYRKEEVNAPLDDDDDLEEIIRNDDQ